MSKIECILKRLVKSRLAMAWREDDDDSQKVMKNVKKEKQKWQRNLSFIRSYPKGKTFPTLTRSNHICEETLHLLCQNSAPAKIPSSMGQKKGRFSLLGRWQKWVGPLSQNFAKWLVVGTKCDEYFFISLSLSFVERAPPGGGGQQH